MNKLVFVLIVTLVTLFPHCDAFAGQTVAATPDYRLGPGDVLTIQVWGFDEFQPKDSSSGIIIRPDGKLAFPLVGEIAAEGVTIPKLTAMITSGLREYILDPKVTVNVLKFRTTRVYVLGEIAKPGMYEIERQHRLLDVIGAAGGHTKEAAKKKVFIIRNGQTTEPIQVNYDAILKKGDMSQNYSIGDGDVVYLTSNGRIDISRDVLPFISIGYFVRAVD